ncbi:MAG: hypothetical protein AAF236_17290, partial [Verrucomicrobiota bacterium]
KNAIQVTAANFFPHETTVINEEPLNRAEGLIGGCWAPLLARGHVVGRAWAKRSDDRLLLRVAKESGATLALGGLNFYRGLALSLGKSDLDYAFVFGKIGAAEIDAWEELIEVPLARGYSFGGRIIALSRTDPNEGVNPIHDPQTGRISDSVGRLLPGIGGRIVQSQLEIEWKPGQFDLVEEAASFDPSGFLLIGEGDGEAVSED